MKGNSPFHLLFVALTLLHVQNLTSFSSFRGGHQACHCLLPLPLGRSFRGYAVAAPGVGLN